MYIVEESFHIYCTVFWPEATLKQQWEIYDIAVERVVLDFKIIVPSHAADATEQCFCGLFWRSGWACDTSPDPRPSVPLESCTSWGQSGGPAGSGPTVIRDKDTYLQPKPRDRRRRGCGDGEGQTGVGGWTRGERGERRAIEWEEYKMKEGKREARIPLSSQLRDVTDMYMWK